MNNDAVLQAAPTATDDLVLDLIRTAAALLATAPDPTPEALTAGDRSALANAQVRACAGAFARVGADLLLSRQLRAHQLHESVRPPQPPDGVSALDMRAVWRLTVVDLAHAVEEAHEAR